MYYWKFLRFRNILLFSISYIYIYILYLLCFTLISRTSLFNFLSCCFFLLLSISRRMEEAHRIENHIEERERERVLIVKNDIYIYIL